jgi:hypothetical protein
VTDYFFQERMSEGLVKLYSERYGLQMFSSRKLRKSTRCASCRRALRKGAVAWADVTACAMNRAERLCDDCVSAGEKDRARQPLPNQQENEP